MENSSESVKRKQNRPGERQRERERERAEVRLNEESDRNKMKWDEKKIIIT